MALKVFLVGIAAALVTSVSAADQQFVDWTVGVNTAKTWSYAATVNDSGSILGEYCAFKTGKCFWTILLDFECEGSAAYPILGNTPSGAVPLQIKCDGKTDQGAYRYVFINWKDLEGLLKDSHEVGFAVPMKSELFKVVRFSLTGRTDAMNLAEGIAVNQNAGNQGQDKSETRKPTSNTTL